MIETTLTEPIIPASAPDDITDALPATEPPASLTPGEEGGEGVAHLRGRLEEAHRDIAEKYKPLEARATPLLTLADRYGGEEGLRRGLSLYDALTGDGDPEAAAEKLLDQLYEAGGDKRYMETARAFIRSHPREMLALLRGEHPELLAQSAPDTGRATAPAATPATSALTEDDFDTPEQYQAYRGALDEKERLAAELAAREAREAQSRQVVTESAIQEQLQQYETERFAVIDRTLAASGITGDEADFLRWKITQQFNASPDVQEFQIAAAQIRNGEKHLADGRARWIDQQLAALTVASLSGRTPPAAAAPPVPPSRPPGTTAPVVPAAATRTPVSLTNRKALMERFTQQETQTT